MVTRSSVGPYQHFEGNRSRLDELAAEAGCTRFESSSRAQREPSFRLRLVRQQRTAGQGEHADTSIRLSLEDVSFLAIARSPLSRCDKLGLTRSRQQGQLSSAPRLSLGPWTRAQ